MTELVQGIKGQIPTAAEAAPTAGVKTDRVKKCEEYCKKLVNAKECAHCKHKYLNRTDDKCWELKENAASHLEGRKSVKSE